MKLGMSTHFKKLLGTLRLSPELYSADLVAACRGAAIYQSCFFLCEHCCLIVWWELWVLTLVLYPD